MAEKKLGKTLFDFIENNTTGKFRKWALIIIAGAIFLFLIGSLIYVVIQSEKDKDVSWLGMKIGENPYITVNIESTCAAQFPTRMAEYLTQVTPNSNPNLSPNDDVNSSCTSLTSTSTPEPTTSVTPMSTLTYPTEEFTDSCIPDIWQIEPQTIMSLNNL